MTIPTTNLNKIYAVSRNISTLEGSDLWLFVSREEADAQRALWLMELQGEEYAGDEFHEYRDGLRVQCDRVQPGHVLEIEAGVASKDKWVDCQNFAQMAWGNPATQKFVAHL